MLFFLTRELWQTVRHFARKSAKQSGIWYWNSQDVGGDIVVHSHDEDKSLSAVLKASVETSRERVPIVVASAELSPEFEQVIERIVNHPGNLRICLILTSRLDDAGIEACREFLRRNRHLESYISTFFLSSRLDSELTPLEPEGVLEDYRSFLLLLCGGREPFAEALGIFRSPLETTVEDLDDSQPESLPSFRPTGMIAVLGVRSWIPKKQQIVRLTQDLLATMVAAEEKAVAPKLRTRILTPMKVVDRALHLSQFEEPLGLEHFVGGIPAPPDSPVETWRVPVSTRRARKERRHLRRVVQQDFATYTASLEAMLDNIRGWLHQQSAADFSVAEQTYKSEIFDHVDLGSISFFLREYFPELGERRDFEAEGPTGWPPDESQDCFSNVYEALEEGLEELPTSGTWRRVGAAGLALLAGAWVFRDADWFIPVGFMAAAFLGPVALWVHRAVKLSELRRQVVQLSDGIYANLRRDFCAEIERVLREVRRRLEEDIRSDAANFGEKLRQEFDSIPLLATKPESDWETIQEDIVRLRREVADAGVDETRLERLVSRMGGLAHRIVEQAGGSPPSSPVRPPEELAPREIVEEWIDELVGSSVLPLEKVEGLSEEILESAGSWRSPAFMAPLTDAELHRGFRKVVAVPNTDIVYQHLYEALPRYSGNPVVNMRLWCGPVPGVAICSVLAGLPDSVLEPHIKA